MKKPAGSVRFYKQKTELNRNRKKPSQNWAKPEKPSQNRENRAKTGKNQAKTEKTEPKPVWTGFFPKKRTEPNRNRSVWPGFGSVSVFFCQKKIFRFSYFFDKNRTEPKMITTTCTSLQFSFFESINIAF